MGIRSEATKMDETILSTEGSNTVEKNCDLNQSSKKKHPEHVVVVTTHHVITHHVTLHSTCTSFVHFSMVSLSNPSRSHTSTEYTPRACEISAAH